MYYKASQFNFISKANNKGALMYNSLQGNIVQLENEHEIELAKKYNRKKKIFDEREEQNEIFKFMIESEFLIPCDEDEGIKLEDLINKREESPVLFITIMPTEDCNFRCVYCFEHFKRGSMSIEIQDGIVSFINKMLSKGLYTALHINWFGGEPLHAFDVVEKLSEKLMALSEEQNIEYSSSITTNGYYLSETNFKRLIDLKVTYYTITVDGLAEDHDKTRILANGGGTFDKIFENLVNMAKTDYKFNVQIRNNYTVDSIEKVEPFIAVLKNSFCFDSRFENVDIRPVLDNGGYNSGNFDECISSINKYAGLEKASEFNLYNKSLKNYIRPTGIVCNASKPNYWLFGADGKIMRCNVELDTEDRNVVGRIIDSQNFSIDFDKLALWLDVGKKDPICKSCFFAPSCQGAYCASLRFNNERNGVKRQPCPDEKKDLSQLLSIIFEEMLHVCKPGQTT